MLAVVFRPVFIIVRLFSFFCLNHNTLFHIWYFISNSMEQCPTSLPEGVYKSPLLDIMWIYRFIHTTFASHVLFVKIHCNIIFPSTRGWPKKCFSFIISDHKFVHTSGQSHAWYLTSSVTLLTIIPLMSDEEYKLCNSPLCSFH